MNHRALFLASLLALAAVPTFAQKKVPGEMWRQTTSMQMMGMNMPSRTMEMCVPVGKASESLSRPQQSDCSVYDAQTSGNRFTAKMRCTGKEPMEGEIETVSDGKTVHGTTHLKMKAGEGTIKFESTRIGTACEATDYSDMKAPVVAVPHVDADAVCKQQIAAIEKEPATIANRAGLFVGRDANCAKSPAQKTFCTLAQTHQGFLALSRHEQRMTRLAADADRGDAGVAPLTAVMGGCGLGRMPAAGEALRARLVGTAEAQGEYEFLLAEGGDPGFSAAAAAARRECSGRAYTSARTPKYAAFCGKYGALLVRGDRAGVKSLLDGSCSGDCGTAAPAAAAAPPAPAAPSAPDAGKDADQGSTKDKAKGAVDKGKRILRGIFSGGD